MISFIKKIFRPVIHKYVSAYRREAHFKKQLSEWKKAGKPIPVPHIVKQVTIKEYQKKFRIKILVETGTYLGDMVQAQLKNFKKIISIELGKDLFLEAKTKFKKNKNVKILHGNSGSLLPEIIKELKEPAIFWLDGHYSEGITAKGDKESPILEELKAIFTSSVDHIILIDDARSFNGTGDYPTIEELSEFISAKNRGFNIKIQDDIILCHKKNK